MAKRTCTSKSLCDLLQNSDSDTESLAEELSDSDAWQSSSSDAESDISDDPVPSDVRTWCAIDCGDDHVAPPRFPFTGAPGIKVDVDDNPLEYLQLFLTAEVIDKIVIETNRYQEQEAATPQRFSRRRKWEPVTSEDIWKFLGLIILQGVVGNPCKNGTGPRTNYWPHLFLDP